MRQRKGVIQTERHTDKPRQRDTDKPRERCGVDHSDHANNRRNDTVVRDELLERRGVRGQERTGEDRRGQERREGDVVNPNTYLTISSCR